MYRVTARRSGDWWALEVPDLPGVFTQAKRLDTAERTAREAISAMLDTDPRNVHVNIEVSLPDLADRAVRDANTARRIAEEAAASAQAAMQKAAAELTRSMRLSQRDAGRVLGVSFQRVSQLLNPGQGIAAGPQGRTARTAVGSRAQKAKPKKAARARSAKGAGSGLAPSKVPEKPPARSMWSGADRSRKAS
jgi:predicted RNase H-like HicB family nuclease